MFRVNTTIPEISNKGGKKIIIINQLELPCATGSNVWPVLEFLLVTVGGKLPGSVGWLTSECSGKLNAGAVQNALKEHKIGSITTRSWRREKEIWEDNFLTFITYLVKLTLRSDLYLYPLYEH